MSLCIAGIAIAEFPLKSLPGVKTTMIRPTLRRVRWCWIVVALLAGRPNARAATTFEIVHEPSRIPIAKAEDAAQLNEQLEELKRDILSLNTPRFALPGSKTIRVRIKDCGAINAFYSPRDGEILFCHEFLLHINEQLDSRGAWNMQLVKDINAFTLLHEVGHAIAHLYSLPVTGSGEDAADQFATIKLIDFDAPQQALNGVEIFNFFSMAPHYSDPHSSGDKRAYNTRCLLWGKYAATNPAVAGWALPEKAQCPFEYARVDAAWKSLMTTYMR